MCSDEVSSSSSFAKTDQAPPSLYTASGPGWSAAYETEYRRFLDDVLDDLDSSGFADDRGLCELPDVSDSLPTSTSPGGFPPPSHSLSKILRDRDESDSLLVWMAELLRATSRRPLSSSPCSVSFRLPSCFFSAPGVGGSGSARSGLQSSSSSARRARHRAAPPPLAAGTTVACAPAVRSCSKKRTWTTTRSGRRSFCAAWMHASLESFLTSIRLDIFLFSILGRLGRN
jgi:hypothetical protein